MSAGFFGRSVGPNGWLSLEDSRHPRAFAVESPFYLSDGKRLR
jgi:hypothetical protein